MSYQSLAVKLKVCADATRLEILDLLSCDELCADNILKYFNISQPTLSHHMKVLVAHHFVEVRKEGNKRMYRLNQEHYQQLIQQLNQIHQSNPMCVCNDLERGGSQ